MDDFGYKEVSPGKQNNNITVKVLAEETGLNYYKLPKKSKK